MYLKIKIGKLKQLMKEKNWSKAELAKKLEMDYSYVYRVLKGERNPGGKFFTGLVALCQEENIPFEDFAQICVDKKGKKEIKE